MEKEQELRNFKTRERGIAAFRPVPRLGIELNNIRRSPYQTMASLRQKHATKQLTVWTEHRLSQTSVKPCKTAKGIIADKQQHRAQHCSNRRLPQ